MAKAQRKRFHRPERDREIFTLLRAVRHMKAPEIARKCFVSSSTIYNWRKVNGTRYPQRMTMDAVARIAGLTFKLVPIEEARDDKRRYADGGELRI